MSPPLTLSLSRSLSSFLPEGVHIGDDGVPSEEHDPLDANSSYEYVSANSNSVPEVREREREGVDVAVVCLWEILKTSTPGFLRIYVLERLRQQKSSV